MHCIEYGIEERRPAEHELQGLGANSEDASLPKEEKRPKE